MQAKGKLDYSLYRCRDILVEKTFTARRQSEFIGKVTMEMNSIKKSILVNMIEKVSYYVSLI